jgi:hypothetical protein
MWYAMGMTETQRSKGGRPKGTQVGETPIRHVRIGPLWEQGRALAAERGMTMTALVEQALRREVARLERQDRQAVTPEEDRLLQD